MFNSTFSIFLVLLLALLQIGSSVATPQVDWRDVTPPHTNAARFARGLPPLTPRQLYKPTRVGARQATTTILPLSGILEIKRVNGDFVGYVSQSYYANGAVKRFVTTSSTSSALGVSFTPSGTFDIQITNPASATFPYLGFAGDSLTAGSTHPLTRTAHTAPGSVPQKVGNAYDSNQDSESDIWTYNSANQQVTPQWINPDGSSPATYLWYFPTLDLIQIISNPGTITASFPTSYQITLTYIP